jgi:hypothetical protein
MEDSTQTPNSGDRNRSRLRDAANHFQHFVWTNVLPIRITKHGSDASAGRGQGGKAHLFKEPGALMQSHALGSTRIFGR